MFCVSEKQFREIRGLSTRLAKGNELLGRVRKELDSASKTADHYQDYDNDISIGIYLGKIKGILNLLTAIDRHLGGDCPSSDYDRNIKIEQGKEIVKLRGKLIEDNWDEFLKAYYHQFCRGCPDGYNSHWQTVIESPQWKAWKATNPPYDFAENEELGCMSPEH